MTRFSSWETKTNFWVGSEGGKSRCCSLTSLLPPPKSWVGGGKANETSVTLHLTGRYVASTLPTFPSDVLTCMVEKMVRDKHKRQEQVLRYLHTTRGRFPPSSGLVPSHLGGIGPERQTVDGCTRRDATWAANVSHMMRGE